MDSKKFGIFITDLRKEQGLTQKELADQIGVTDKAISRWETGKNYPDIEMMERLSGALGISISELLQSERPDQTEVVKAGSKSVVDTIKKNRKAKKIFCVILAVILIALIVVSTLLIKEHNNPIIEHNLELYSPDTSSILNNMDAFIKQDGNQDYTLTDASIYMNAEKEISDLQIDGITVNNRRYYCGAIGDYCELSYAYVYEHKQKKEWQSGIECTALIDFINAIHFENYDKQYSISNTYLIDLADCSEWNGEIECNDGKPKYLFDDKTKKFRELKAGEKLTGTFAYLELSKFYKGSGESIAHFLYEI